MTLILAEGSIRGHRQLHRPSVCLSVCPSVSIFFVTRLSGTLFSTLFQMVIVFVLLQLMTGQFLYLKNIIQERTVHIVDNSSCSTFRVIALRQKRNFLISFLLFISYWFETSCMERILYKKGSCKWYITLVIAPYSAQSYYPLTKLHFMLITPVLLQLMI